MSDESQYIVGNWKMHGQPGQARILAASVARHGSGGRRVVLCPPATLFAEVAAALQGSQLSLGGQDCHAEREGAYTGDLSAAMLKEAGCACVIVGHSERRQGHGESSELVRRKAETAIAAGLVPIICIGETLQEREAGKADSVIGRQISESLPKSLKDKSFIIAYEPVWAIGTGKTPTAENIRAMHGFIKKAAAEQSGLAPGQVRVLYGGSVKAENAKEILGIEGVSGVLVGGASLKADEFCNIIDAAR